jgi:hypothetical protein
MLLMNETAHLICCACETGLSLAILLCDGEWWVANDSAVDIDKVWHATES